MSDYPEFLARKAKVFHGSGIESRELPAMLYDWQGAITRWALRKGRAALFEDCGLGKTFQQVAWASAIGERTLFLAPLCVAEQTVGEAAKLGVDVRYCQNQEQADKADTPFIITNYERLDGFDAGNYKAVVLDESSILKAFDGKTRTKLIETFKRTPYRLCCTATPSPNDIAELANHAEFLGLMTRQEFLATWFVHDDQGWRMKRHAVQPFYRWLASWAIAIRRPSDLGYSDEGFTLPALTITDSIVESENTGDTLFPELGLHGLKGRLSARRGSLDDRVDVASRLAASNADQWLFWCGLNPESDALAEAIPDAVNVQGSDTYAVKREAVEAFVRGDIRVLISKVKILGFGLNLQNCRHMGFVGSVSLRLSEVRAGLRPVRAPIWYRTSYGHTR